MSEAQLSPALAGETTTLDDFQALLTKEFKPKSDTARDAVSVAVKALAEQALAQTVLVSDDALASITQLIAAIDAKLTEQVNLIIHHKDFQDARLTCERFHHPRDVGFFVAGRNDDRDAFLGTRGHR